MEELGQMEQISKSHYLEDMVLLRSPAEVTEVMKRLGEFNKTACALGLACRFRGLEHVKALVEGGATFKYKNSGDEGLGYWTYDYSLGLLNMRSAVQFSSHVDRRSLISYDTGKIPDRKGGEVNIKVIPIEERAEIARYLCENREHAGFDPCEALFFSIMSDSREITAVLKEYGAKFTEKRIADLTENGRSFDWMDFCFLTRRIETDRFIPIMTQIVEQLGGKKLHYTDTIYYDNYNDYRKEYRFFNPEIFRFILDNFNQTKMAKGKIMKGAITENSVECLKICAENGWMKQPKKRDEIIQYAADNEHTECTAWLLEFKNNTADLAAERKRAEKRMMAQLNADPNSVSEMKKIWSYEKLEDGGLVIKRYKGNRTEVEVPEKIGKDTVTVIGEGAFSPFASRIPRERSEFLNTIKKVILPDTIKAIETKAFHYMTSLEEINIPKSVERIGEDAFGYCLSMTSFEFPDTVKEIGAKMFAGSTKLERVRLPSGLAEIGDYMFSACLSLKEVNIPASVKRIGIWGFRRCKELEEITLPEGVEEIAREAFADCEKLKTVVLPESVKVIKNYRSPPETPFHGSPNVKAVVVPKSYAEKYCKRNNIAF
ncbi:MAG: leucine-rich repeat domain-containing protein [Oscillospiraceae bacterium]|nr:leucine-rich repeat domain-containing protein [Oscillospiraceae bacterium]